MSGLAMINRMYNPQLSDLALKGMEERGYAPKALAEVSWPAQDKDLITIVSASAYVVSNELPEEVVYAMTKAIVEKKPELVPSMDQYDPEMSADPKLNGLPLHPGALTYYRAAGLVKE